jgi:hypothetical protein
MKKIFTYILSTLAFATFGQSIELQLNPTKDCNNHSYCVDIQLKKGSLAASDVVIGTSSILLNYDADVLSFNHYVSKNFAENSPCQGWLPQRYDAISRQGELDVTLSLNQTGNACPVIGNDAVDVGQVCFDIIQQGASPNIHFELNHSQFNKNDVDDGTAVIAIATAASIDEKNLLACDCPGTGEPCDDGNIYTINDRYDVFCKCFGQYEDADQDGILDGVDNCLDQKYEAENAELNEVTVRNNVPQFCGLGYVDYLHNTGDFIDFLVNVTADGLHQLAFRYALETGNRPLELTIDGNVADPDMDFPETGAWTNWGIVSTDYFLTAGPHNIRLTTIGQNGPNLDQLILSFCSGCAETGQPCDDGNNCTSDDVIGLDCNCGGRLEDTDLDGICNVLDECEGFDDAADSDGDGIPDGCDTCDNSLIGTPCDDGDPCTENDLYVTGCQCLGDFVGADSDGDGVCDSYDLCPGGNDAFDADGDGIPDDCDTCDNRLLGTPCDDGDPCTLLDIMRPGCNCLGIYFDSDDDGVCTELDLCEGFDDTIDNDGDGLPDACDNSLAISPKMEIGKAFGVGDDWQTIILENTYQSMIVVATVILPNNDLQPVVTRIRNAVGNKFELRVQNPSEEVKTSYVVQYVVAEEGIYTQAEDGFNMEARKEISVETANKASYIREQRDYFQTYDNPVIVGQVMTFNDDRWSVFWSSRHNSGSTPASSLGFAAGKMIAEDSVAVRADETIGFLIFESGKYGRDGVRFEARLGENTIKGTQDSEAGYSYQLDLEKPNHAVLSTSGLNGSDGGWPVLFGDQLFRDNTMFLAFDEDQTVDSERYHTTEEISYLAFEIIPALELISVQKINPSCHGGSNGSASVTVAGGEMPYGYLWSTGATSSSINNLAAGTYEVTITDSIGTKIVKEVVIGQPPLLDVFVQGSSISCFGANDGYVNAVSIGGTGQHSALWNNGATSLEMGNLPAGNYTVTITDQNGCSKIADYEIDEPSQLIVSGTTTDVTCFGENSGAISTSIAGGTGTKTYQWSNGSVMPNLSNLFSGTYSVTAVDGNGCTAASTFEVAQPPILEATTTTTFTSCNGGSDGTATVTVTGGTGDVKYLWSNGETTPMIENLTVGTYQVTLTDANACTTVATANVTDPAMLSAVVEIIQPSCAGDSNGALSAEVSGGTGNIIYEWSNGQTESSILQLAAGTYELTVTDANGCTVVSTAEMVAPAELTLNLETTPASCEGVSNGAVTVNAIGGVGNYSYSWNTGDTAASILNLPNGEYAVTVIDGNGCEAHFFDTVGVLGELFLPATIINVSCNGGADGVIDVTPLGATPPYAFEWSNDTTSQSAIWMLEVGNYSVTVSDADGCVVIDTFSISEPEELQVSVDQVTPAIGNNADGAVAITVEGGTPGYSFQWLLNNNLMSEEEDPTGLPAGEYTLLLTDDHGCDTSLTIVIESVTSAEERNLLQHIQLTPNPTTGQFSLLLDLPNNKEVTAAIYDISGKIISAAIPVVDRHDFDLTNEAAGVYLLRIRVGEMEVAKRVVVID